VFWVISVYFNIRNTLPNYFTFLLGHTLYVLHIYIYTYIYNLFIYHRHSYMFRCTCIFFRESYTSILLKLQKLSKISNSVNSVDWNVIVTVDDEINLKHAVSCVSCYNYSMWQLLAWWQYIHICTYVVHLLIWVINTRRLCKAYSTHGSACDWICRVAVFRQWSMNDPDCFFADTNPPAPPPPHFLPPSCLHVMLGVLLCGGSFLERQWNSCCTLVAECLRNVENSECRLLCRTTFETYAHLTDGKGIDLWRRFTHRKFQNLYIDVHYGPGVVSASSRNECRECFLGLRRPVRRADNPTTFMYWLSWNLGALTSWNP
jgi:hypothetical protein